MQEGGRGGGYNDRQDTVASKRAVEAENGYDDFGRRVVQRAGDKKQRAQAALERLRKKPCVEEVCQVELRITTDVRRRRRSCQGPGCVKEPLKLRIGANEHPNGLEKTWHNPRISL